MPHMHSSDKWLLFEKGDKVRYYKNRFSIIMLIFTLIFPLLVLIDGLINGLWKQVLLVMFALGFTGSVIIELSSNEQLGLLIGTIGSYLYCIYYNATRINNSRLVLHKNGWKYLSSSNEKTLKLAISHWEKEGYIQRNTKN